MIKQSLLDSLAGLPIVEAERAVLAAGHRVYIIDPQAAAITLIARPNMVLLWNDGTVVKRANAGDGLELDPN